MTGLGLVKRKLLLNYLEFFVHRAFFQHGPTKSNALSKMEPKFGNQSKTQERQPFGRSKS